MGILSKLAPALVGFALAAATASIAAEEPTVKAGRLLAEAKQATGGAAWDKLKSLSEHGTIAGTGLEGPYESVVDLRHVLDVQRYVLGPTTGAQGWDGKAAWSADSSGQVRVEQSKAAIAGAIQQAYRSAYAFFWPARWPATRTYVGDRNADGVTYDAVEVTPKGAEPFEVWIDRRTHRIAREVQIGGEQPHTQILSDYRPVGGVLLPFVNRDTMGQAQFDMVATTGGFEPGGTLPAARFAPPPPPKEPDPFPAGQDRVSFPITLVNNHIHIDAAINGQPPQSFIFDTGAPAVLATRYAAALGIKAQGALPGGGFGENAAAMGFAKVRSVSIGGFALQDQVFATFDTASLAQGEGADFAGLLGYEIPKRAVTVIDYAKGVMTLVRPSAFTPPAGAVAVPFTFNEHIPMIEASVDGVAGEFELDTGARSGLTLMGPFAAANHLTERYHATRLVTGGYGVGGPSKELLARAGELKIGSIVLKEPVALIATGERGTGAATEIAGNIGGELLRRFTLTLDYGHQLVYLQRNGAFDAPEIFDRSGLWLMRLPDGSTEIADVTQGGPGEAAGLKTGDRIVAIDGGRSADVTLSDLRDRMKAPPGTTLTLSVVRDGDAPHDAVLTLADLI
jgi:hypothetical protein